MNLMLVSDNRDKDDVGDANNGNHPESNGEDEDDNSDASGKVDGRNNHGDIKDADDHNDDGRSSSIPMQLSRVE